MKDLFAAPLSGDESFIAGNSSSSLLWVALASFHRGLPVSRYFEIASRTKKPDAHGLLGLLGWSTSRSTGPLIISPFFAGLDPFRWLLGFALLHRKSARCLAVQHSVSSRSRLRCRCCCRGVDFGLSLFRTSKRSFPARATREAKYISRTLKKRQLGRCSRTGRIWVRVLTFTPVESLRQGARRTGRASRIINSRYQVVTQGFGCMRPGANGTCALGAVTLPTRFFPHLR